MNPEIFREYDIRGVVGKDLSDEDVVLIGKAFGTYLRGQNRSKVTIGRDCRLSGDNYRDLVIEGLLSTGCDVVDIGVCPTPVFYFSIRHLKKEGGIMVTASHNPPEYNGFKLCSGYDTLFGDHIQKLLQIIESGNFAQGNGTAETADVVGPYKELIQGNIKLAKPLRVGIDAGNGTAGVLAVPIIRNLDCEVFDIYCDMDGNFPNHEPDPTVLKNMQDLIGLVKDKGLDVGLGYDGD